MILSTPSDSAMLGERLARLLRAGDVIALYGDLGAGKTTICRAILRGLGLQGEAASPTFPIVLPYDPPEVRLPVWHVDLYRVEDQDELEELALDEARGTVALLIEWPERMGAWLWPDSLRLHLSIAEDGSRALTADVPPAWESRWPFP